VIGVNTSRPANSVVIYNGDYSYSAPQTNAYGGEAAVDKSGKVISAPKYGTCKTQIPDGGFVISGIGTGYTWLSSSVKVGDYVFFDPATGTLSVYSDRDRYLSQSKSTHASAIYGDLPIPSKPGTEFLGWYISGTDTRVTKDTVCTSAFTVILRASWDKFNGHTVGYNAQGGSFTGIASTTVNGINVSRPANSVVIYDSSLGLSAPQTNEFGCEIAVDKNGAVLSVPKYGTCKTTIPNGGFVISTIGTGFTWLSQNVKEGCYADFNKKTGILTIYKDKTTYDAHCKEILPGKPIGAFPEVTRQYHKLVGWYNQNGTKVTEATLMPAGGLSLFAKWEVLPGALSFNADGGSVCGLISSAKLTGENVTRTSGALILYRDKASTGTNIYGSEAVITSDGTVCAVYPYGRGNAAIPEGCFVLSGNGAMSSWIQNNLKAGYHVTLEGGTVSVWADKNAYNAKATTTVKYGEKYGILPTATKEGYVFCGWKDKNGTVVTEGATVSLYGDVTLTAVWEKLCTVTFDPAGGTVVSGGEAVKLSGINVSRGSNALVMYAGGASTRTNVYGSEAVVKFDGTVVSVYPYGRGNTAIPAGCFVLSGNGTMSTWIQKNLKAGGYVTVKGFNITAYESYAAYDAADGKLLVRKGSPMGGEASAFFKNKALNGWYLKDALYTKSSVITSDVTLTAGWTIVSAQASFNTAGGAFHPPVSTVTANAVNTSRPSNSLVIYDAGYKNAYPLTNPYGTEVAVDANGIVLSSPVYGACKTPIPEGGFVISGVGTGYKWLLQNVSAGCYIHRDGDSAVITVYRSYGDYLYTLGKTLNLNQPYGTLPTPTRDGYIFCGWTDSRGNAVTESTIVTSCDDPTLTATWKAILSISLDPDGGSISSPAATISGINVSRGSNSLVLYRDKASTGTNIYGTEAVADKDGRIIELRYYGKGNASIPEGGFVLSAHGTMADWVRANISVGYYIGISDTTVTVYKTELSRAAATKSPVTVYEGTKVEGLPTPVKHGYKFLGWFCGNAQLREGDKISASAAYTASWAPVEMTVTLDAADGYFAPVAVCTANGVNVQRGSNQLIIYNGADGRTTTGTNVYGTEIVVNAAGAVVEVRTYGKGNAAIPKGGYVISAHGSAAAALPTTIAAGDSVTVKDLKITIYKKGVSRQNAVITGRYSYPLGALPTPRRDGYSFVGWHTTDGILITEKTPVTFATANFTLYAHWEKTK